MLTSWFDCFHRFTNNFQKEDNIIIFDVNYKEFEQQMKKLNFNEELKNISSEDFCGYTVTTNDKKFMFISREISNTEQIISFFHELTHIYTIDNYSASINGTSAFDGYLLWRELIAEYTAYSCYCHCFNGNDIVNQDAFEKYLKIFIKYKDTYDLISLISIIMLMKIDLDNISFDWFEQTPKNIAIIGCLKELLYVFKQSLNINRNKIPVSVFTSFAEVETELYTI